MKQKYSLDCISWNITLHCNLKCFHCEFSAGKPSLNELTTEESLHLCEDLAKINCKRIILMGGEPFLRKDWYEIAKKIKQLNMEVAFISNGYTVSKKLIDQLKSLMPTFVGVSIDGGTAKTHDRIRGVKGSYDRALQFIDLCIHSKIPIIVITSVHKLNIKELPILRDIIYKKDILLWEIQTTDVEGRFPKKYLLNKEEFYSVGQFIANAQKKYSAKKKFVNGAHDMGYNSSFLPDLTGFKKWHGCQAGVSILAIESDGGIKGCSALNDRFVEDNIRNRNIKDIWNDPNAFAYNRKFKIENLKGYCRVCKYGKSCKGGCIETSYMLTGDLHCDPYCFYQIEQRYLKNK